MFTKKFFKKNVNNIILATIMIILILIYLYFNLNNFQENLSSEYCNSRKIYVKMQIQTKNISGAGGTVRAIKLYKGGQAMSYNKEISFNLDKGQNKTSGWYEVPIKSNCVEEFVDNVDLISGSSPIKIAYAKVWIKSGNASMMKTVTNGLIDWSGRNFMYPNQLRLKNFANI